ncbi:MAG: hypothetical protein HZB23_03805 [Deltaproteobacteria bacterium]|nr:hypothetical protein [Deltaproteobacteria bacterium]
MRAIFFLITLLLIQSTTCRSFAGESGEWAKEAALLHGETHKARRIEVISPDKRKVAVISGVTLGVRMDGKNLTVTGHTEIETLAEMQWSADSSAFFITESYGGAVGDWHVTVYLLGEKKVESYDVTQKAFPAFKKHFVCIEPEDPNFGALKWLEGSKKLLVAAEVPPHSSCPEMGKLRGYVIEVPSGNILKEYEEDKLRTIFGEYFGNRLSR